MKERKRNKVDNIIGIGSILFFLYVIWYCIKTQFYYYIADSIVFIVLTLILFLFYKQWRLDTFTFFAVIISFALHDLGAFRFYANSPLPLEWDVVTHIWGMFAATLFIYNIVRDLTKKDHHVFLFF